MTHIIYTTMPFIYEDKCFVKIHRTVCIAPNSPDLNQVDYAVYGNGDNRPLDIHPPFVYVFVSTPAITTMTTSHFI